MKKILLFALLLLFACENNDKDDDRTVEIGLENIDENISDDMSTQLEDSELELEEDMSAVFDKITLNPAKTNETVYDSVTGFHSKERNWSFAKSDTLKFTREQQDIQIVRDVSVSGSAAIKARFSDAEKHYEFPGQNVQSITKIEVERSYDRLANGTVSRFVNDTLISSFGSKARDVASNFESLLTRDTQDESVWNMQHEGTRTLEMSINLNGRTFEMNRNMSVEFEGIKVKAVQKKNHHKKRFTIISGKIFRTITFKSGEKLFIVTTYYDCHSLVSEKVKKTKYKRVFYKNEISESNIIRSVTAYCRK